MRFVGVSVRTRNVDEGDSATARIPRLWQRFYDDAIAAQIPERQDEAVAYGVYFDYAGDRHNEYSVLAGCAVEVSARRDGLHVVSAAHAEYLVFSANGAMPHAIVDTWTRIWKYFDAAPPYRRAFTVDFERYDLTNAERAEIYIAVLPC